MTTETETPTWTDRAKEIGKSAFDCIAEMVANLERAREIEAGDYDWEEEAVRLGFVESFGEWKKGEERFDDAEEACRSLDKNDELYLNEEAARQRIEEDPLSLQVRSGWTSLGEELKAEEFELLLGTGGPAVRIIGYLDQYGNPDNPRLQVQDWFQPWTDYLLADEDTLLTYCGCFYFG
jgi:hypothetical protein